jgi:protein involved in polysaccharide export with SLBB domain/glycosyltransferase involved in cell wall biosynthesis
MKRAPVYRVAIVAACPFPSLRGSQVLVRETAEALARAGHAVHVVTYPTAQHLVPIERIAIHRAAKLPGLWTARPFGWQKLVLDVLLAWRLWQVVRRQRIDVIHAHNLEAPLIAYLVRALTGVPVVYHAHNALADELPCYFRAAVARRLAGWVGRRSDRMLARRSDYTVALSDRLAAYLAARGAAGRIATVAPAASRLTAADAPVPRRERAPLVMYAGNLDPYQDLDCLLQGFARLRAAEPQARLVLVTHAAAHPKTVGRAAALAEHPGVTVQVVNSFAAAMRTLAAADVLVCPRASWSGFPIKVLNYMALGRPIVHAQASAHAVEDGVSGLLFADGDAGALARALLRIVRDPALAAQLGRTARAVARERYGTARVLARLAAVHERVIDGARSTRGELRDDAGEAGEMEYPMVPNGNTVAARRSSRSRSGPHSLTLLAGIFLIGTLIGCAAKPTEAPLPPVAEPLSPSLIDTGQYQLEPGDVLRVKFIYQPEMDVKVQIDPDGNIAIPGVGSIQARGKTAEELATDIETLSSSNLRDPEVTVIVAELGPRKVYVGGEVRLPGPVPYRVGMTPMQAILDRGGFTEVARIDSVLHVSSKQNNVEATRLDFSATVKQGSPELATLAVNDVIYVPRTFIGDADAFVRLYIRGLMPTMPRLGIGFTP